MKFNKWFYGKKGGSTTDYEDYSFYHHIFNMVYDPYKVETSLLTDITCVVEDAYKEGYKQAQKDTLKQKESLKEKPVWTGTSKG